MHRPLQKVFPDTFPSHLHCVFCIPAETACPDTVLNAGCCDPLVLTSSLSSEHGGSSLRCHYLGRQFLLSYEKEQTGAASGELQGLRKGRFPEIIWCHCLVLSWRKNLSRVICLSCLSITKGAQGNSSSKVKITRLRHKKHITGFKNV